MEGSDEGVSEATNLFRNNKEEGMIREERDNENINKEDTVGDGKLAHHGLGSADPSKGFVIGTLEYVL